jgi:hypothetical protein
MEDRRAWVAVVDRELKYRLLQYGLLTILDFAMTARNINCLEPGNIGRFADGPLARAG